MTGGQEGVETTASVKSTNRVAWTLTQDVVRQKAEDPLQNQEKSREPHTCSVHKRRWKHGAAFMGAGDLSHLKELSLQSSGTEPR